MLTNEEEAFIDVIELGMDIGDTSFTEEDMEHYRALISKRSENA